MEDPDPYMNTGPPPWSLEITMTQEIETGFGSEQIVTDPDGKFYGSGIFDLWSLNPGSGMSKKSRSGSGMKISNHISESFPLLATIY